ncbi:MAG TPA: hypothetical protein VNH18_27325, partial [Bryobacteraceae bacterium]|nr:hypothetical protein [Bryobacteraceae bacterium]
MASVILMWYGAQWRFVSEGWQMVRESPWPITAVVLGFAAYRLYVAVRAWRKEVVSASRDFDNLRRRLQIYAEFGSSAQETEDISALITLWMTRAWKKMSKPQLLLLYREAQRDSPSCLGQKIHVLVREHCGEDPRHWSWVALDSICARIAFVNLFSACDSSPFVEPNGSGPHCPSYVEAFLTQPDRSPAKWADLLEKDLRRYGKAWFQTLVECVEQRDDIGLWPPEITGSHAERLEMVLWILYEEYIGSRPLPRHREAVRHLHLHVPPSLLDVPITRQDFRDETESGPEGTGMERFVDRRVLSLD